MTIETIKISYRQTGLKGVIWTALQEIRLSLFWTRDMKRKENVGQARRWLGRKILDLQNTKFLAL